MSQQNSYSCSHYVAQWLHGNYHCDDVVTTYTGRIVHGSWVCACPCSCSKHNRFSLATPMKFGNFGPYFMLFMPTIIVTSCPVHAQFMHFMGVNMHELGMNKGLYNPIFHAHESYSHAHEVMPLLHAHTPLLRDQKHEQSLFMGMN